MEIFKRKLTYVILFKKRQNKFIMFKKTKVKKRKLKE